MTRCGHSFCHSCISRHLEIAKQDCPVCGAPLKADQIFPNFTLNKLLERSSPSNLPIPLVSATFGSPMIMPSPGADLSRTELERLLAALAEQKRLLDEREGELDLVALEEFLSKSRAKREEERTALLRHISCLDSDLALVRSRLRFARNRSARLDGGAGGEATRPGELSQQEQPDGVVATVGSSQEEQGGGRRRKRKAAGGDAVHTPDNADVSVPHPPHGAGHVPEADVDGPAATPELPVQAPNPPIHLLPKQRKVLSRHMDDLEEAYEEYRLGARSPAHDSDPLAPLLPPLRASLRLTRLRTLARLSYTDAGPTGAQGQPSSIVSGVDFDRDDELFATAGVTRRIKVFELAGAVVDYRELYGREGGGSGARDRSGSVRAPGERARPSAGPASTYTQVAAAVAQAREAEVEAAGNGVARKSRKSRRGRSGAGSRRSRPPSADEDEDESEEEEDEDWDGVARFPVREMVGRSKISCVSWNSYIKSQLLSADYEGVVTLWDAADGRAVRGFEEHEKRAWSVEFSRVDPGVAASGSDDAKVKVWAMNQRHSVCTIEAKANVCSVRFNPEVSHQLAFGSADHFVHLYDIRSTAQPIHVFKSHKKAVSYVKFTGKEDFVTASTDGTLKLWSIAESTRNSRSAVVRTFTGHTNEKNFVGLSVNSASDLIACGSETNEVFVYHRGLSRPLLTHRFGGRDVSAAGEPAQEEEAGLFVSSVCWRRHDPAQMVCANSAGRLKVVEVA